ncbi:MAG TPA: hypothetical protein VNG13_08050 [Mycobacteriales bacterium]|nr:hypothetical protein [Mycobacteriales bacterium]
MRRLSRPAEIAGLVEELTAAEPAADRVRVLAALGRAIAASARQAGITAVGSGRWLAGLVADLAPRVPVRDLPTLRAQHEGLAADALAAALIETASRATAAVGAAGGALAGVEFAAPPTLLSAPVQLAAETVAVVAIELKLVAELHEVYARPATGTPAQRGLSYLGAWARRRGLDQSAEDGIVGVLSSATRRELRQRVARRLGRNVTTLAPFLVGAVAGGALNRRETRRLGERIAADLRP